MSSEIELKLLVRPEDLPKIENTAPFKELTSGSGRTRDLVSRYFDTQDFQLRRRGIALRVRSENNRNIQCVKSDGERVGGVMVRDEWENPVPTADPMLAAIDDESLRRLATPDDRQPLGEIFRTEVRRTSREVSIGNDCQVTMDLDVGSIRYGDLSEPISELELELRAGDPGQLYDLALSLHKRVALRVSTQSKSARGYALASGEGPGWQKDPGVDLSGDASVGEALGHIVQHCLDHMLANEGCVLHDDHPEGVHQMRVAMRRLRSALRLFHEVVPAEQYKWIVGEVRWLTNALGPARDWDVFLEDVVEPVAAQFPDEAGFGVLRDAVNARRAVHREAARQAVLSKRYTGLLLGAGAWIARRGWRQPAKGTASPLLDGPVTAISNRLLDRRHKKVRKSGRRFKTLTAEQRHQLRIDVKKLRYAAGFFSSLYGGGKAVKPFIGQLTGLQDSLGYLNDVRVAGRLLRELTGDAEGDDRVACLRAGGMILGWHTHAMVQSQRTLASEVAAFIACAPFWTKAEDPARC